MGVCPQDLGPVPMSGTGFARNKASPVVGERKKRKDYGKSTWY